MFTTIDGATCCCPLIVHRLLWQHFLNSKNETFKINYASLLFMKGIYFFFTLITLTSSTSSMWVSLNAMRCFLRGYPSRIVWTNNHFQMVITTDIIAGKYKMQSPTWSSPSWSSKISSCGSHATTWPFVMNTPPLFTKSHSIPHHLDQHVFVIFEIVPLTPWPYITLSFPCAFR